MVGATIDYFGSHRLKGKEATSSGRWKNIPRRQVDCMEKRREFDVSKPVILKRQGRSCEKVQGEPVRGEAQVEDGGVDPDEVMELTQSSYHRTHMPRRTHLGEFFFVMAKAIPFTGTSRKKNAQSPHQLFHILLKISVVAIGIHLVSYMPLLQRYQQFLIGLNLLIAAGIAFFVGSHILTQFTLTHEVGELLSHRIVYAYEHWEGNPLRSFLEICVWLACVLGSYAVSHSYIISIVGGTIAGMVGAITGDLFMGYIEYVERQIEETEQQHSAARAVKFILLCSCIGYLAYGLSGIIYELVTTDAPVLEEEIHNVTMSYLLVVMLGISLVVASELFMLWMPTRSAGMILQSRLIDTRKNWESKPLRSLGEAGTAFIVMFLCYGYFEDVTVSVQLGTLSAIAVVLGSELVSNRGIIHPMSTQSNASSRLLIRRESGNSYHSEHWIKILPLLCLGSYVTIRVFLVLFRHAQELVTAVLLATVIGIGFLLLSTILAQMCGGTSRMGNILSHRFTHFTGHMKDKPVRTFVETSCWLGTIYGTLALYNDTLTAGGAGVMSALIIVAWGEFMYASEHSTEEACETRSNLGKGGLVFMVFTLIGILSFHTIYTYFHHVGMSFLLATLVGIVLTSYSERIFAWKSTYLAEEILYDRWINIHQNWKIFPLRSFMELSCWCGVFYGSFIISSDVLLASLFSTLSGIFVTLAGELLRYQLHPGAELFYEVGDVSKSTRITSLVVILVVGCFTNMILYVIYRNIRSIEVAFVLATFSGIGFISTSELFMLWKPTRIVGNILQERILNMQENWRVSTERSTLELVCWLSIMYGSYALSGEFFLSMQIGTLSAVCIVLMGEYLRQSMALNSHECEAKNRTRPKVLPFILLLGYVGLGTFHWIFINIRKIEMSVVLVTITGIVLVAIADLLVSWKPTRVAGIILQERFVCIQPNWKNYPVRSFIELGCWLGVIYGSYGIYGDLLVAVQCGTLSGMLVTLVGELAKRLLKVDLGKKEPILLNKSPKSSLTEDCLQDPSLTPQGKILPLPIICLFGFIGALVFNTIYSHLRSIEIAFCLATLTGIAFVIASDILVIWSPTRMVGGIMQQRIIYISKNVELHPFRTLCEGVLTSFSLWLSFTCFGNLMIAIQIGTATCILVCVAAELLVCNLRSFEKHLAGVSRRRLSFQSNAPLLKMPYEVLFEIGRFLAPEDLLNARSLCHVVKDMLRAEASRFWQYVHLRKSGADPRSSFGTRARLDNLSYPVRSLIYDTFRSLAPKLFLREPLSLLKSEFSSHRYIRWVYLNSEWIRSQALPKREGNWIRLSETDVGYDIFRYIPDKNLLNIREEVHGLLDLPILILPGEVYHRIQEEPLSFVASTTLYDVKTLSVWFLASVMLFAMGILCVSMLVRDVWWQISSLTSAS